MSAVGVSFGAGGLGNPIALTDGFSAAFLGAAGIAVVNALLALVTLRQPAMAPVEKGTGRTRRQCGEPQRRQ